MARDGSLRRAAVPRTPNRRNDSESFCGPTEEIIALKRLKYEACVIQLVRFQAKNTCVRQVYINSPSHTSRRVEGPGQKQNQKPPWHCDTSRHATKPNGSGYAGNGAYGKPLGHLFSRCCRPSESGKRKRQKEVETGAGSRRDERERERERHAERVTTHVRYNTSERRQSSRRREKGQRIDSQIERGEEYNARREFIACWLRRRRRHGETVIGSPKTRGHT
ncbi:hypothetical protein F2P81_019531 [Scophthalmus maximus]|uniref:Uncharacterized protein n=1 Tax=Scophthalmus maximus TaxID=52904 RepID=A0A6A4SC65_SCOMX|nr:hypothetical protein F2P81_019531 [Scophthalmus maximus]